MTKEQIKEAYTIAERYFLESKIYTTYHDQFSKDLGPLGLKLNYDQLEKTRPVIADMLQ